jgi:cell division control protein 45
MYLPRNLFSHLYLQLLRTHHALSPPVLILTAVDPDALCACRILTALLKRDYISHKLIPISGYGALAQTGEELVKPMRTMDGGSGGVVICLGVGGLVDLPDILGLSPEDEDQMGGVEVWVIDARRPWNLENVFGGEPTRPALADTNANVRARTSGVENGRILRSYKSGRGGIIVFDDGDIEEELNKERDAFLALEQMPEVDDDGEESDDSDDDNDDETRRIEEGTSGSKKRKSWSDRENEEETEDEDGPPRQRRRSNSVRTSTYPEPTQILTTTELLNTVLSLPFATTTNPSEGTLCSNPPQTTPPPSTIP